MFLSLYKSIKHLFKIMVLNSEQKKFIKFNKNKWQKYKQHNTNNIILVDLFPWNPWIYFWSYVVNLLAKKTNSEIKFFHFVLYKGLISKHKFSINILSKIFNSFNVKNGLTEYDIEVTDNDKKKFLDNFKSIKVKKDLINYKYKNIKIGDLIYANYLRTYLKPTIELSDNKLKNIFVKAHLIFDYVDLFLKENNVKAIIPSHLCYVPYGLISRIGKIKYDIPIIKIFSKNRGSNLFRLINISKDLLDENPYYKFKDEFNKLTDDEKTEGINVGKKIMENRLSGNYDKNLPYMKINQFNFNKNKKINVDLKKKNIFVFAHCFFDNPMRYRNMIFPDFYEQIDYLLSLSDKDENYQWFYKSHPNELKSHENVQSMFEKKYKKVIFLSKDFNHNSVLKLNPYLAITNFGTVAHEFAYMNVPVINTGDNPHINYDFCLHPQNMQQLNDMIFNLKNYLNKLNFDKKQIYEYLFMQYEYFANLNGEKKLISDNYFNFNNLAQGSEDSLLEYYVKNDGKNSDNIKLYVNRFLDKTLN